MPDPAALAVFLALSILFSLVWGLSLRYLDERSQVLRRWVFFVMGFTRRRSGEVRALLLSIIYYGIGLLAALLFAISFGLAVSAVISFSATHLALTILGIVAEISLSNLFVDLGCRIMGQGRPEQFAEVREIPWIKGLREFPSGVAPLVAAFGGVVEEIFFRGVLLLILMDKLMVAPLLAVMITGTLFCLQQLLQVRTRFQAMVIGSGCVAISLVGGLLVVFTGSVVPAVLCHASFVIFFMTQGSGVSAGLSPGTEAAAR